MTDLRCSKAGVFALAALVLSSIVFAAAASSQQASGRALPISADSTAGTSTASESSSESDQTIQTTEVGGWVSAPSNLTLTAPTSTRVAAPVATSGSATAAIEPETGLSRMILLLNPEPASETALESLLAAQQNPASPLYHQWLTPAEFGQRFGANTASLNLVTNWLRAQGFTIDEIPAGNHLILFSGTAAKIESAFHASVHRIAASAPGQSSPVQPSRIALDSEPEIPAELTSLVAGIVSLHGASRESQIARITPVNTPTANTPAPSADQPSAQSETAGAETVQTETTQAEILRPSAPHSAPAAPRTTSAPQWDMGGSHYLYPGDLAAIYDIAPLYERETTGKGIAIAIPGRSNILASDVATFRTAAGLSALAPTVLTPAGNPGLAGTDQGESTLDVEWAGAIAPDAKIILVAEASTESTDGIDLASAYIVNHNLAPIVSLSYATCEQSMSTTELAFYNQLWKQAAAQGITVVAASGDSGAAGCQAGAASTGQQQAVNGLCSSPYSTCVGGTEFDEGADPSKYWEASNSSSNSSALGYIPEVAWNESALDGGTGLWSTGGGASTIYAQPAWQTNMNGIQPADVGATGPMRAVPDLALTAATHDGYIVIENGTDWIVSGTSAATPSFAAILALVVQKHGTQGAANPALYLLLQAPANPWHATPSGSNTVPGVTGFDATGSPYNLSTGLGSPDAAQLVENWKLTRPPTPIGTPIPGPGGIHSAP